MKKISFLCILLIAYSCGIEDTIVPKNPEPANLVFPENNQECNQGVVIVGTNRTEVTFIWENDSNADTYTVVLKNLITNTERIFAPKINELNVDLIKATPYSWYVISTNSYILEPIQSETWKFYNAGDPITSHAPFPADDVYPEMAGVYSDITSVRLEWNGLDIDNDIKDYDIYFDTVSPPVALLGNTIQNAMDAEVTSGNVYYWKVVTTDNEGNNSQSEIFQFKVN